MLILYLRFWSRARHGIGYREHWSEMQSSVKAERGGLVETGKEKAGEMMAEETMHKSLSNH